MDAAPDAGVADVVVEVARTVVVTVAEARQAGDGEVDVLGAQELGDHATARRREARVRARVLGVIRRSGQERRPRVVVERGIVAVGVAGPDRGDRPPELEVVLGVEARDERVGVGDLDHRHEPGRLHDVQLVVEHELAECVVRLLDGRLPPEPRRHRLLGAAHALGRVLEPISFTSLYSRAHFLLPSAGGPSGRNWSAERRANGRISPR